MKQAKIKEIPIKLERIIVNEPKSVSEIDLLRQRIEYLDNLVFELIEDRKFIMAALIDGGLIEACNADGDTAQESARKRRTEIVLLVDNEKKD